MSLSYILANFCLIAMIFFSHLGANQIGIITHTDYVGDREVAWRIKIAAENLGWTVFIDENEGRQISTQQLDWVICMLPNNAFLNPHCPNYLMVFHPFNYLDNHREFFPFYERYDGYLLTIHDRDSLENSLKLKNKDFHYIPFFPSLYEIPYDEVELNYLMLMIPVWSNRLNDPKFKRLYRLLSETNVTKFYGVHPHQEIISNNYMGSLPFDGISIIDALKKNGIAFVFHSDIHNQERIPSSRIFEAAAASTVIISDQNPFVKEHFVDSVFYVDTSVSAENLFKQINEHLITIYSNPENALQMAKRAHQIFIENFTMEKQLLKLEEMHQKILFLKKMNCKYILLFLIVSFSSVESIDFVLFTEPKTGTHFLIPILEELTKKKVYWAPEFQKNETLSEHVEIASEDPNFFIFSLNQLAWNKKTMDQVWDIAMNSRRFLHLHAPYSIPMENYMIEKKCINFFIKRDPRDQIVSLLNHYKYIHFNDKEVELIPTDDERLLYMIKNQLRINTINFRKWLTSSMCCVLNFEKLIGFQETKVPQADAMEEMRKMTAALQLETSDEHLIRIYEKHFGRGWSFFKGKSGVWRDYFNEEHKRAVKEEIGDLLIEWGYEENLDW